MRNGAATVAPGATRPPSSSGELAVGFYADSGFGDALTTGSGFTPRVNVSPANDMELLTEDQLTTAAIPPNATVRSGPSTWLMATVVFRAGTATAVAPGPPGQPTATAMNGSVSLTWSAAGDGGSAITSYVVTPYIGAAAQTPVVVAGTPPATSTTVNGLTNGTAYSFTVAATNAIGKGPNSVASNTVVPGPQAGGSWDSLTD